MMKNQLDGPEDKSKLFPKSAGQVVLPFDEEYFKKFMSGLLGTPQSISRNITGTFEIEIKDLENLYHLILQRISQQNNGVLLRFLARIVFSDDSSIELNGLEALVTYNEIRPLAPRGIHLTWDFLVRFQDKEVPEKQRIQVSFLTGEYERRKLGRLFLDSDEDNIAPLYYLRSASSRGFVNFRIEHTARTWGTDIEALLTNHIKSLVKEGSKVKNYLAEHDAAVGLVAALIFLILALGGGYYSIRQAQNIQISEFNALAQNIQAGIELVNARLEFLGNMILDGNGVWSPTAIMFYVIVCFIIAFVLLVWVGMSASWDEPSFILITRQALRKKEESLQKRRRGVVSFIIAFIASIVSGIIANYIFAWFVV